MWLMYGLIAIGFQVTRTALQKELADSIPRLAATWVRYAFGLPFCLILWAVLWGLGEQVYSFTLLFWLYSIAAGVLQIVATNLLLKVFTLRSFMVGTCYGKSDSIQTALLGWVLFGEALGILELAMVIAGFAGVLLVSVERDSMSVKSFLDIRGNKGAQIGILTGSCFALTALGIRQAILQLDATSVFMASTTTLVVVVVMQVVILFAYLCIRQRNSFSMIAKYMKKSTMVGLTSCIGSVFWFMAFATAYASYVKALAQIQMPLSILYSYLMFREKIYRHEIIGMAIIIISVTMLVFI